MVEALLVSQVILWLLVLVLAAVVAALVRQVGVLHERVAPMGALTIDKGPRIGEQAPGFELTDLDGREVKIGGANPMGKSSLLMFVSTSCPVCRKLLPIVKSLARGESGWLRLVFAGDGEEADHRRFVRSHHLAGFPFVLSTELGMAYQVSRLPYAILIDDQGVIRGKGLVNTREHLESIVEARRMGVGSIQEYLKDASRIGNGTPDAVQIEGGGKLDG